ncbi:hypothetical protein J8273_1164 [Carpediemonas membranifera]|uniref:Uncharacterized protein n=1 Tax=Carpediemonas membranifera TaxID=201153 RepID=A0A8J6B9Z3_9EUKA|nr:hypothetical protein J8273_1164 [Carpediemonas membranifera]|eukprot:KAG9397249.1 hypothetical protein J8273_1164 [Carpediemonas membranifera]
MWLLKSKKKAATRKEDKNSAILDVLGCETALFRASFPDDDEERIMLIEELTTDLEKKLRGKESDIDPEYATKYHNMSYALFTDIQVRKGFLDDLYNREAEQKAGKRKASDNMPDEEEKAEIESGVAEDMDAAWIYSELARTSFELRLKNAKKKGEDARVHMRDLAMVRFLQGEMYAENGMREPAEADVRGAIEALALATDEEKPLPCQLDAIIVMGTLVLRRKKKEQQQEVLDHIAQAKAILERLQQTDALVSIPLDYWREAILDLEQNWDEIKNMTKEVTDSEDSDDSSDMESSGDEDEVAVRAKN